MKKKVLKGTAVLLFGILMVAMTSCGSDSPVVEDAIAKTEAASVTEDTKPVVTEVTPDLLKGEWIHDEKQDSVTHWYTFKITEAYYFSSTVIEGTIIFKELEVINGNRNILFDNKRGTFKMDLTTNTIKVLTEEGDNEYLFEFETTKLHKHLYIKQGSEMIDYLFYK